jgi:hypothetical protein
VFVFGSNLTGRDGRGAARQAYEQFGAQRGVGGGRTGRTYAFPTLTADGTRVSDEHLQLSVAKFYRYAAAHPEVEITEA